MTLGRPIHCFYQGYVYRNLKMDTVDFLVSSIDSTYLPLEGGGAELAKKLYGFWIRRSDKAVVEMDQIVVKQSQFSDWRTVTE